MAMLAQASLTVGDIVARSALLCVLVGGLAATAVIAAACAPEQPPSQDDEPGEDE